jgi:hypothetical protein
MTVCRVALTLLDTWLEVPVHPQDVLRDHPVTLLVRVVGDDEQQVETGQQRVWQCDVSVGVLVYVVLVRISAEPEHRGIKCGTALTCP